MAVGQVARLLISITANTSKAQKTLQGLGGNVKRMMGDADKYMKNATKSANMFTDILSSGLKVGGILAGIRTLEYAVGDVLGSAIEFNKTLDDANAAFRTMTGGNVGMAKDLTNQMVQMATMTPLSTENILKAGVTLNAVGMEADSLLGILKMLGDVARGNSDRFQRLAYAFAQVQAAGRLMGQENLQFTNALFSPLQIIADQLAKTYGGRSQQYMSQTKKAMENGAISANMVTQAFILATQKGGRFYNAMVEASKTFQGQMSMFKEQSTIIIAAGLKPIMDFMTNYLLPIANYVLGKIIQVFGLLGVKVQDNKKQFQQLQTTGVNATSEIGGAAKKATKNIEDQQKAANDNLQSFDELNTLQKESNDAASNIGAAGIGVGSAPDLQAIMDKATAGLSINFEFPNLEPEVVTNFKTALLNLANTPEVTTFLSTISGKAQEVRNTLSIPLPAVFDNINLSMQTFSTSITTFLSTSWNIFKTSVLDYLSTSDFTFSIELLAGSIANIGTAITGVIGAFSIIIGLIDTVANKNFDSITSSATMFTGGITVLTSSIFYLMTALASDGADLFSNAVQRSSDLISNVFTVTVQIATGIVAGLGAIFKTTGEGLLLVYNQNIAPLKELFLDVWGTISDLLNSVVVNVIQPLLIPIFESLSSTITRVMPIIWQLISTIFNNIILIVTALWQNKLKPLVDFVSNNIIPVFKPVFTEVGNIIKDVFSSTMGIITNLLGMLSGLTTFLLGVFTGDWTKAFEGIRDVVANIFSGVVNLVRIPVNSIIRIINNLIEQINKIEFNMPDILGGGKVSLPKIPKMTEMPELKPPGSVPKLATGGIVTSPTMAMIGEGRYNEAVIPLGGSQMDVLVNAISNAVIQGMQTVNAGVNRGNDKSNVVINIDGKQIAKAIVPYIDEEKGRTGKSVIMTV
jgi:hypothetical protein